VGRTVAKTEDEVADELMAQLHQRSHPQTPPAIATDGNGSYRQAMLQTWGQVPQYSGRGRPPSRQQAQACWQYLQVVKHRQGQRVTQVNIQVVYGVPEQVIEMLGQHTAYVERTHLTSRQMNGRLVRKTLSYSKQLELLEAACAWEDWIYNLTRKRETLRVEVNDGQRRWQPRSPAMAAGLSDHLWSTEELLTRVVAPSSINTN
jgi:hypothetical protein